MDDSLAGICATAFGIFVFLIVLLPHPNRKTPTRPRFMDSSLSDSERQKAWFNWEVLGMDDDDFCSS